MIKFGREVKYLFDVPEKAELYLWGDYETPLTREEAEGALSKGQVIYQAIFLTNGHTILENTLAETGEILLTEKELIRPYLLQQAEELLPGESVLVKGQPMMCKEGGALCFGGFGRSSRGRAWAITESNTHTLGPKNLVNALLEEQMISPEQYEAWLQLPKSCPHPHFIADPF